MNAGNGTSADHLDRQLFADYLTRTRWFGGKGRTFEVTGIRVLGEVPGGLEESPDVLIHLVEVTYAEGDTELYQVPLAFYERPEGRLDHAFIGWWEDPERGWVHAYDAVHDRQAMACWLRSFDTASDGAIDPDHALAFHRVPGHDLDISTHSSLFSGEQSNSSVAFGEDALMKVFRKVTPGVNPDIQIHQVLTEAGSEHVAALYGWLDVVAAPDAAHEAPEEQSVIQLAMLQEFLRTATDGWDLALASVRGLLGDPEVHAAEAGGDFAPEATRLGDAVAAVHRQLALHFPTETRGGDATAALARTMSERLDRAAHAVPELAAHADRLRAVFARVADLGGLEVQRIHGDLHLGQTLRTARGWKIVDFEGEPAKPLGERMLPDSPWRDVAGMLRSFDYAPRSVEHSHLDDGDPELAELRRQRAEEWAHRNRNHFLVAYGGDLTVEQRILLDAYVADKAVYETVYEARNRPGWLSIPLEALAQIGA